MKRIGPCLLLSFVSILAHSQESQPVGTSPERSVADPVQAPVNSKPFLRGEEVNPILPASRSAGQPVDLREQLDSLKSFLSGRRGLVEIPPGAPAGWWEGIGTSMFRFLDDRGNSLPDMSGHISSGTLNGFKSGWNNALLLRATETDRASADRYAGFINMQFHYTGAKGGINNYNNKGGTKTDYFNVMATTEMRTVGQKTGIASYLSSFSGGDTMGIQSYVTQFGGYDTGGDEQTEAIRIQTQQGSSSKGDSGGIFEGVVSAIRANTLTYEPKRDENTIGEDRMIRNLDRVYSAGSITSITNSGGSPNTVTVIGDGTNWSRLGLDAHTQWNSLAGGGGVTSTDLAFCFDPLKNDGYDTCFPISAIADDTHLTLNLLGTGTALNTNWPIAWPVRGEYRIYGAAWPTSVDPAAHTLTAPSLSGFSAGNRIDQILAYNTEITGQLVLMSRHIGIPNRGGGINILNHGTPNSPIMEFGVSVSGGFDSAIAIQYSNQRSGVPNYFGHLFSDPSSKIMFDSTAARNPAPDISLWRLRDSTGANHTMLRFLRDSATTCVLDSSLCVSAKGAVATNQLDQNAPNDYAGVIIISAATSASIPFKQPFKSTPVCTLTPTSDPTEVGAYWVSATPASVTANVKRAGRISFTYICVGNPS
jgi:hypothetical protein